MSTADPHQLPTFVEVTQSEFYLGSSGLRGGLYASLCQTAAREPFVTLNTVIGYGAEFTPAQLRDLAAKLNHLADAAEVQPMGKRKYKARYLRFAPLSAEKKTLNPHTP